MTWYDNDAVVEFVCVGVYTRRCHHSCDVERLEAGIASHSIFGSPLRDKFLLDRWKGLVSPEHHSWVFCSEGRVEDDVLNVNNPFGKLVHFLVPFKKYAVPVAVPASEVKNTREGGQFAIRFDLPDDQVRHGVWRERTSLDLLSGRQAEKLVSPLKVSSGAEHYCRGGASHHGVRWCRFIMNLAVRPEW
jgi:hypothetical protein